MSIINGVGRIGIRSYVATQQITTSTLLNSLYSVWNADTLGTSLDSSIFGAWNAEASNNITVKNAWNANGNVNDSKGTANGTIAAPSGTTFVTGTMSFGTGKLGSGAFTFNGSNFISLPADTLSFTGDFSVSMWVYIPSLVSSTSYIALLSAFDNKTGYTTVRGWRLFYYNNQIDFRLGETYSTNPNSTLANMTLRNQWVHIVATRKSSSLTTIYINGVQAAQTNNSVNPIYNSNNLAYIGASFYGFSQPYYSSLAPNGVKIDSIQTWETILDQTAVTELYNSGNGQQYPFTVSNALIPSFSDVLGNYIGTPPSGSVPVFTTGKIGNAFSFDGVNDYIPFPTNSWNSLIGTDLTISLWVKFASTANQTLISNMSSPSINVWSGWEIRLDGGRPTIYMWNNSGTGVGAQGAVVSTNTWYHIVATRKKGSRTRIYINGSLAQTDTNTPDPSINGTYYPNIGHLQYSSTYHGLYMTNGSLIDSVNLWSKEISADEVTQLYNLGTGVQYPYSSQTLPSTKNQFAVDNGTLMNGCTLTDGKIGKAFTFDGVNDYVTLPDNSLNFIGDFTTSFWFYANAFAGQDSFVTCENWVAPNDNGWYIYHKQGNLGFSVYNGTNATGWKTSTTITNGTWYHVVVVKNRSVSPKFYINGALVDAVLRHGTDTTLNAGYATTQYCSLGTDRYAVSTAQAYLNGKMDGVNVWQREITQAEVTELYNSGAGKQLTPTPIVTNGLVLNLDAGRKSSYPNTGTTWFDISGNANNGTLTNGPIFGTANGGVITFDGVNDYVQMSNTLTLGTNQFTIEFWINNKYNYTSGNLKNTILSNYLDYASSWNTYLYIGIYYGTNGGDFGSFNSNGDIYLINSVGNFIMNSSNTGKINITNNQWTHVCFVRNGNDVSTYKNGVKLATINNVSTANNNYSGSRSFKIGGGVSNTQNHFGDLSNNRIYNTALTDVEVLQNFNATKSRFGL